MSETVRFGVSMEDDLLQRFDRLIDERGYETRSDAVRHLVREALVAAEWEAGDGPAMATVSLVYDHHDHDIGHKLVHLQHDHVTQVVSSLHVHIDERNCLEVIVLRGRARDIRTLGEALVSAKGIKHGKLMLTTEGRTI